MVNSPDGGCPLDDDAARLDRHRRIGLLVDVLGDDVRGRGEDVSSSGGAPAIPPATLSG